MPLNPGCAPHFASSAPSSEDKKGSPPFCRIHYALAMLNLHARSDVPTDSSTCEKPVRRPLSPLTKALVAIAVYTVVYSFFSIQRWNTAYLGDPDYGLFNQSFWTTTHKGWLLWNTYESGTHFATHNSPILLLLVPFYALLPRMETLLVVQALAVALTGLAVYKLAARMLDEDSALMLCLACLFYHPLHGVNYDQFNELSFLPAPLLFAFYNLYRRRMGWFWFAITLALFCKEDVSFVTFMIGLYMIGLGWRASRNASAWDPLVKHGLLLVLVSAAWLAFSLFVLFPSLRGGVEWPYFRERYGHLGNTFGEVVQTMVLRPWIMLPYLFSHRAILVFLELVLPLALLPLLAPRLLMIAAPTWMILQLSSYGAMGHNAGSRYMAPVIVAVFAAAIVGLRQAVAPTDTLAEEIPPLSEMERRQAQRRVRWALGLTILFALAIDTTPFRFPFRNIPWLTAHQRARNALVDLIPANASVSTQPEFFGHVSDRVEAYIGYHPGTDYVLVDPTPDYTGKQTWFKHAKWDVNLPRLLGSGEYQEVRNADGALLLKRREEPGVPSR